MELAISDDKLRIRLSLWEKMLSVHGSFEIRLDRITGATTEAPRTKWRDLKLPGTYMPWVIKAGSYLTGRGWEFCYMVRWRNFLTVELRDRYYRRIILSLTDNQEWSDRINESI